jgi:hypothetical protein
MFRARIAIVVAGFLLLWVPAAAQAQTALDPETQNELVIAMNKAAAAAGAARIEEMNQLTQCQIAAASGMVPSGSGPCSSLNTPPSPPSPPSSTGGTCVAAFRSLTSSEFDTVNDYEIAVNAAGTHKLPPPPMSSDVGALIGCL